MCFVWCVLFGRVFVCIWVYLGVFGCVLVCFGVFGCVLVRLNEELINKHCASQVIRIGVRIHRGAVCSSHGAHHSLTPPEISDYIIPIRLRTRTRKRKIEIEIERE